MVTERGPASPATTEIPAWRITYTEIASLAQVKRPVPTNWSRRHADFPAPVAREGGRPLFDARAIVDWLTATGHGNAEPRRLRAELALHTLSAWRTPILSASLIGALTALICLRTQYDAPLASHGANGILAKAARLDSEDQLLLSELRAVPEPDRMLPALAVLTDELCEAAYNPAEAFDWVLESRHRLGYGPTDDQPTPIVTRALVALSGIDTLDEGSVIATPHARSGDLLAALHAHAGKGSGHTYLAADPDSTLVRLVRRRMLVRGVYEFQLDVTQNEDLSTSVDEWGDPHLLVCILPYEAAETRKPEAVLDRIQVLADYLASGSTAIILGPADALVGSLPQHGAADRLRRSFLRHGLLQGVVNLPKGAFPYRPAYQTAVWILARAAKNNPSGHALLADLSASPLTEPVITALAEDIATARTNGWRGDHRHHPHHAVIVPVRALVGQPGVALTPPRIQAHSRYTRTVMERPARISEFEQRLMELQEQAHLHADLRAVTGFQVVLRPEGPVRRTTVRRLLDQRRLRKRPGHRLAFEHIVPEGQYQVLGPDEILGTEQIGNRRVNRGSILTVYEHVQFTESCDLVITTSPSFGVHVDTDGLSVVLAPARILRVPPNAHPPVRPRVLAALLRAAAVERARTGSATRASSHIENLEIPDLGQTEADRYELLLIEMERRAALLREQSAVLEKLIRLTAAGIADGTLTIRNLSGTDG